MDVRRGLPVVVATVAVLVAVTLHLGGALGGLEAALRDRLSDPPGVSDRLLVVGIEEDHAPAELAELLTLLERAGAMAVGWSDLVVPADLAPVDRDLLAPALARTGTVVARMDAVPLTSGGGDDASVRPRWVERWVPEEGVPAHALVPRPDRGAAVRTLPLTVRVRDGERFVALPVVLLAAAAGRVGDAAAATFEADGLRVGEVTVPDDDGALRIAFDPALVEDVPGTTVGGGAASRAPYRSASAVLAGDTGAARGRVVLVGSVDFRGARYVPVPGGPPSGVPEVWVHANALNTILLGAYSVPVPVWQDLVAMVLLAGLGTAAVRRGPLWTGGALVLGAGGLWLVLAARRLATGDVPAVVAALAALLLAAGGAFALRYATETRQRRRVARLFSSYVPAVVARELMDDPRRAERAAAGERVDVTVFFCDLRGFTATAATLEPDQVRELLEVYYRWTGEAVLDAGGTLMQYVGDEVFAVFGAPLPGTDHAERAVACAIEAQRRTAAIADELARRGLPPIAYGIGLQSGPVVAAHVGATDQRRQYAVVGDTVNVGARLCSRAGAGEVVISEDVLARTVAAPACEPLEPVPLKGVARELSVFRLTGI